MNQEKGLKELNIGELNEVTGGVVLPVQFEETNAWMIVCRDAYNRRLIHSKYFLSEKYARWMQRQWLHMRDLVEVRADVAEKFLKSKGIIVRDF